DLMAAPETQALTHRFDRRTVVGERSTAADADEVFGLLGPNMSCAAAPGRGRGLLEYRRNAGPQGCLFPSTSKLRMSHTRLTRSPLPTGWRSGPAPCRH